MTINPTPLLKRLGALCWCGWMNRSAVLGIEVGVSDMTCEGQYLLYGAGINLEATLDAYSESN